jgi:hypothetical protein
MHRRRGGAHAAVAFVFDQAQRAGFGDGEVDAGQADVGVRNFSRSTLRPIWISASTLSV